MVRLASSLETNFYVARFFYFFFSCFDTQTRSNLYCLGKVKNQIIRVLNCLTFGFFKDWYGHNAKLNFLQEKYQPWKKDISCVKLAYETSAAKAAKKSKAWFFEQASCSTASITDQFLTLPSRHLTVWSTGRCWTVSFKSQPVRYSWYTPKWSMLFLFGVLSLPYTQRAFACAYTNSKRTI